MDKIKVHHAVLLFVEEKINQLKSVLDEICHSTAEDSKSSAGDKHETSTSMAQLEQEKLSKQIKDFIQLKEILDKINPSIGHNKIELGSLIETNRGWYYFSVGVGLVNVEKENIFCLTLQSPIGQLLKGKSISEKIVFNGNETIVLSVK